MFDQVTRKLTPEVSVHKTVRLSPEWLQAQVALDARPTDCTSETATTRETSFETPTLPSICPQFPEHLSDPEKTSRETRERYADLQASLEQFARFGWNRRRVEDGFGELVLNHRDVHGGGQKSQFVREYLAIHQRCADGLSVTDIAAANACYVESSTRHFVGKLALSHWDLYEVVGIRDDSMTLSSRFDSRLVVVRGLDLEVETGDVVVARLVDMGCATVASSMVIPTHRQQAALHDRLADSFEGRSWSGFMRGPGASIVLRWALELL